MATLNQKIKLFRGLLTGEQARTGPFYVTIDMTNRCNLKCLGCVFHSSYVDSSLRPGNEKIDLSFDLFKGLCDSLRAIETKTIFFQGSGEPMLNHDLYKMIALAKETSLHTTQLTNGTHLNDKTAQALIDSGLDILRVSLWASSEEQYKLNYPGSDPENFTKIIKNIKLLSRMKAEQKRAKPDIHIFYVINRNNFQSIEKMVDLAYQAGCNGLAFSPMVNFKGALPSFPLSNDEEQMALESLSWTAEKLESLSMSHNIDYALSRYQIKFPLWKTHPCYIAWFHAIISSDGAVKSCGRCDSSMQFGNLKKNTFQEIWNGNAIRSFRRQTMSRNGLERMSKHCDCTQCCFFKDIIDVHKIFKWFSPFVSINDKTTVQ